MAFSTGSGNSSSRTPTTLAEINVTPLVDVMLVLLIVFMVSAPLMQQGVQIDLPKANAGSMNETPEQIVLTINKAKQITMNDKAIAREPFGPAWKRFPRFVRTSMFSFQLTKGCLTASSLKSWLK